MNPFNYNEAFSRNLGWIDSKEQSTLKSKRIAIAGMGGVGFDHMVRMARLGIGNFTLSDLDVFEQVNFNRQYGATMSTVGQPKVDVAEEVLRSINPEAEVRSLKDGVNEENLDEFLADADIYIDSLDFFALDIRRAVFKRCRELGIPAITAAPMGMGTALLVFTQDSMSFDDYFDFDSVDGFEDKMIKFIVGLSPSMQQRHYIGDEGGIDLYQRRVPSTALGISLAAGVACTTALKVLLQRGEIVVAPRGLHFDAYQNRCVNTWRPWGNKNPIQKALFHLTKRLLNSKRS